MRSTSLSLLALLALMLTVTGCASKKYVNKQVTPVQSQIAVLTEEVARLDESLADMRGAVQNTSARVVESRPVQGGGSVSGSTYRTPSGFELPSADIQQALKNAGYYQGAIDGKVGPATEAAIRAFQRDNGLNADGICGRMTWQRLKSYLSR